MDVDWASFTPWAALAGGLLIGTASIAFVLLLGRIAGVSGIVAGILAPRKEDLGWRLAFVAGLLAAPSVQALLGRETALEIKASFAALVIAGLLVGIGTRYASGCTSGHGVCGLSRLSPRSLVATVVFMSAGFITVFILRHLLPG